MKKRIIRGCVALIVGYILISVLFGIPWFIHLLFLSLTVFLVGSGCALVVLNKRYKKTNHYNNQFADVRKFCSAQAFLLDIPHNLDVINLGSTHPKFGFEYSETNVKGMNWAVGPQTLEYDYEILKKYHSFLREGGCVIIPLCIFKLFLYRYKDRMSSIKYYPFLDYSLIVGYSSKLNKREIRYPLFYHPKRLRYLLRDISKDTRMELVGNPMSRLQIEQDADHWVHKIWEPEFGIDLDHLNLSKENVKSIRENIRILRSILHFCVERGYKPVITILPLTNELGGKFSESFVKEHLISYIKQANDIQAPVLNYMRDSRFTDSDLYINSFFFNKRGRQEFTKSVIDDLKSGGLL